MGAVNVRVSLSNFGLESHFITKLPQNDVGTAVVNALRYFGVDISKVIYDRAYSAIALAEKRDFDWNRILEDVGWFHWTGINPALSDDLADICLDACKVAREKKIIISCDLNYRSSLWSSEEAQKVMKPLLKYVDVCICNEEDAEKVLGIKTPNTDVENGKLSDEGYVHTAEMIYRYYGCKYIATTLRKSYSASRNG